MKVDCDITHLTDEEWKPVEIDEEGEIKPIAVGSNQAELTLRFRFTMDTNGKTKPAPVAMTYSWETFCTNGDLEPQKFERGTGWRKGNSQEVVEAKFALPPEQMILIALEGEYTHLGMGIYDDGEFALDIHVKRE